MENITKDKEIVRCEHESDLVIKRSELFEELVKIRESNKIIYGYMDTGISPEELYYHKYADKEYKKVMLREWRYKKKILPMLIRIVSIIELTLITGIIWLMFMI